MKRYLIEGRIIPERINFDMPAFDFTTTRADVSLSGRLSILKSKIFIHVSAPDEAKVPDIRNMLLTVIADVVNYVGFYLVCGISWELESITDVDDRSTFVFGVEGHAFHDRSEFGNKLTFAPAGHDAPLQISGDLIFNSAISRATHELRNSIRYPDFTALHCRLAIEAIRNHFDADDEAEGWRKMREALKLSRSTIETFQDIAAIQRHGRNTLQTWEQRRRCMQIAWETTHRLARHLQGDQQLSSSQIL